MAQYDGSIRINTQIDTNGIRRGESEVRGSLNRISDAAKRTMKVLASVFAVKKLIQFGKEAMELGSDLEEVQNVVDVTFTTMSEKVNEFSKNAIASAGLSETMAKRYVGTFGAMSKSFGFAEDEAYQMSTALTQLSGDVASFYNISQDEAYTKLKSVFTGETETLKDLGVVMTQASLDQYALANGFGKTTSKMTEQEKVALRYRFVMDQLAGASGDFIRTSDSWANQTRILKLQLESLMATIGSGLINIFTPVIKVINILLGKLATVANAFKSFTELVTGKKASAGSGGAAGAGIVGGGLGESVDGYNEASNAADNLANSTEKVADATKDAKKAAEGYLNPLDEINKNLKKEEFSSLEEPEVGIGDISGIENIDYGKVAEGENVLDKVSESAGGLIGKLKELAGIFKQGFFDGLGDWEYRWDSIKESLKDIFTNPEVISAADSFVKSAAYMLGSLVGATASIGLTLATNIVGGIEKYLEENKDRIKEHFISMFNIWEEISYLLADLFQSFAYVFEAFASEDGQRLTANLIGIFTDAFMGVMELASKLIRDILNIFIQPFTENKEEFRTALEGFLGVLADVAGTVKDAIDDTFDKLNQVYDEHSKPFFDSIANGISDLVKRFLDFWNGKVQPVLDQMAKGFDELWKTHIQPLVDNLIGFLGKIADLLKALWGKILQPFYAWLIENIFPVIIPFIQALWYVLSDFVAYIADVANAIITSVGGVIDFLTGAFTGDWNLAFQGLEEIVSGFVDLINATTNEIIEIGNNIILGLMEGISAAMSGIFQWVKEVIIDPFVNAFKSLFGIHSPSTVMAEMGRYIIEGLLNGIKSLVPNVQEIWERMKETALIIWNSVKDSLADTWESIRQTAVDTWEGIKQNLYEKWENLKSGAKETFENIKGRIEESWAGIKENVKESAGNVKTSISDAWTRVKENTSAAWGNIKEKAVSSAQSMAASVREKLGSLQDGFRSFSSSAQNIWGSAWEGMKRKVTSIMDSVKSAVESAFNWIVSKVDSMKEKLSDVGNKAKSIFGGATGGIFKFTSSIFKSSGYSFSRSAMPASLYSAPAFDALRTAPIPRLATGAVIPANKEFLAVLGEQKHGTNVEAPLDTIRQASEEAVLNVLSRLGISGNVGNSNPQTIVVKMIADGKELTDLVIRNGEVRQMSSGNNPFLLGTT